MHYMLLYHFVFISYVVVCHRTYKLADVVAVCIQFVCIYVFISFFVLERKQRKEQHPTWCERSTVREKHSWQLLHDGSVFVGFPQWDSWWNQRLLSFPLGCWQKPGGGRRWSRTYSVSPDKIWATTDSTLTAGIITYIKNNSLWCGDMFNLIRGYLETQAQLALSIR